MSSAIDQIKRNIERLKTVKVTHIKPSNCPHWIMMPEHYNQDGTCKCHDYRHKIMITWGYKWNKDKGQWIGNPNE